MGKRYSVLYTSGATGFGWEKEFDRLDEFEDFINEMRSDYTASLMVYDETIKDIIFWKTALTYDAKVDLLSNYDRDMRTTTRHIKAS